MHAKIILLIACICIASIVCGCGSHSDIENGLTYDEYLAKAQEYTATGETEKAIVAYKKALAIRPEDAQTHFRLGKIYKDEYWRTYSEAQRRFQYDVLSNQNNHPIKNMSDELRKYGLKTGYDLFALNEFKETIKYSPANSDARYYIAVDHFSNKRYREAVDELKRVVDSDPKNTNAYQLMGDAQLAMGEYDLALDNYNRAFQLDADSEYYYYKQGRVYIKMNDGEKAGEMFKRLKDMKSSYADKLMTYKYYPKTRD